MNRPWLPLLRQLALALGVTALSACVDTGTEEDSGSSGGAVDNTPGVTACEGDPLPGDRDCDGLTDTEEAEGWSVTVDYTGRGDTQTYEVTSNPDAADTDGDGLDDFTEYTNHYDPRKADSDEDGLNDYDEKYIYATQPLNADSDGDNVNTDQFKDGDEVARGTSPLEADSDGDGMNDPLEALTLLTNPRVADKPAIGFKFTEAPTLTLNCSETDGTSSTHGFSAEESISESSSVNYENAFSVGLEHSIAASVGTEMEARAGLIDYGGMTVTMEVTQSVTQSFNTSFAMGGEHTNERGESFSQFEEQSVEHSRTCEDADITTWAQLTNNGDMSFKMDNMSVVVYEFNRVSPNQRGTPIATLFPVQSDLAVTLAPGATATVELTTGENKLPLEVAKKLMTRRVYLEAFEAGTANVWISPVGTEKNYAYQADDVKAKTATVVVDAGGPAQAHQVAVKQRFDAETGQVLGLTVAEVADAIGLQYTTEAVDLDMDGKAVAVKRIASLNGVANDPANNMRWLVAGDFTTLADSGYDIEQVRLQPGDTMNFLYTRDADGDGIGYQEEALYGTSDDAIDSDGDGLPDYEEIRSGWEVVTAQGTYRVYPDPSRADDYDGDGLTDTEEKAQGTNPYARDTEGDYVHDGIDPDPVSFTSGPSISDFIGTPVTSGSETHLKLDWVNGTDPVADGILIIKSYAPWNGTPVSGTTYGSGDAITDEDGVDGYFKWDLTAGEATITDTHDSVGKSVYYYAWPYAIGPNGPVYLKRFSAQLNLDLGNVTLTDDGDSIRIGWDKPAFNFGGTLVLRALASGPNRVNEAVVDGLVPTDGVDYSSLVGSGTYFYTEDSSGNRTSYDGISVLYASDGESFTDVDVDPGSEGTDRDYYYVVYGYDNNFNYFSGQRVLRRNQLYIVEPGMDGALQTRVRFEKGDRIDINTSGQWILDSYQGMDTHSTDGSGDEGVFYADGSWASQYYFSYSEAWFPGPNRYAGECDGGGVAWLHAPVFRINTGASISDYRAIHRDPVVGYDDQWSTSGYDGTAGGVELYACTIGGLSDGADGDYEWYTREQKSDSHYRVRIRLQRWKTLTP